MKKIKLLFIDPVANHNKFYNMEEIVGDKFIAHWGRVGSNGSKQEYPMSDFDKILRSKKNKGYNDVTVDDTIIAKSGTGVTTVDNLKPNIKALLEKLNKYAKEAIKLNYDIAPMDVSKVLVTNAQTIIDDINKILELNVSIPAINALLLKLYNTIPRKMKNVRDQLVNVPVDNDTELDKIRDKMVMEQGLLDVMKSQITAVENDPASANTTQSKVLTVLDQLGLEIDEISKTEEDMLKKMMTDSSHKFIEAFKIVNYKTQKNFDNEITKSSNTETRLLFHGSRAENWISILKTGLVLRPNAHTTGTLFSHGIYFADDADKSMGYIDGGRWSSNGSVSDNWLAVYDVHIGNFATYNDLPKTTAKNVDLAEWIPKKKYDSYFANRNIEKRYNLRKNEYIVYNEAKCTIKYLIHVNH